MIKYKRKIYSLNQECIDIIDSVRVANNCNGASEALRLIIMMIKRNSIALHNNNNINTLDKS